MEQDALWMVDKAGHERGGCCMSMTLRDYARVGLFMLGGGKAGGKDVLPAGWVDEATTNQAPQGASPKAGYGYFWWPVDPPNYQARGIFGQGIAVYPDENLVIAMNSAMAEGDRPQAVGSNARHDCGDPRGPERRRLTMAPATEHRIDTTQGCAILSGMIERLIRIGVALAVAFVFTGRMEAAAAHCARIATEQAVDPPQPEAAPCHGMDEAAPSA